MADILGLLPILARSHRVHNQPALIVHKGEEWQPGGTAQALHHLLSAGTVEWLLVVMLLDGNVRPNEILVEDGLNLR
jgi:hypothetical protein